MSERAPIRIFRDADGNPAIIHIRAPHRTGEDVIERVVEQHMFGDDIDDRRVAVLRSATRRRNSKPPIMDPNDLEKRFGKERGIRIVTYRILNWPLGSVIRPPNPSTSF